MATSEMLPLFSAISLEDMAVLQTDAYESGFFTPGRNRRFFTDAVVAVGELYRYHARALKQSVSNPDEAVSIANAQQQLPCTFGRVESP